MLVLVKLTSCGALWFKNDPEYQQYNIALIDSLQIPNPDFSQAKLQVRFWVSLHASGKKEFYSLTLDEESGWQFHKYVLDIFKVKMLNSSVITPSPNWANRWDTLVANKILSMPSESKVRRKWKTTKKEISITADGHSYTLEILTKKRKRRYLYNNPESNLEQYDLNNEDLVRINKVLDILNDELKFRK